MKKCLIFLLTFLFCIGLCSCGEKGSEEIIIKETLGDSLIHVKTMQLEYASGFSVDYYKDENTANEYTLISVCGESPLLLVDENEELPKGLTSDIVVVKNPQQIYLVASQVMDMFVAIHAIDELKFSALKQEDWYIKEAQQEMETGNLIYAGKYSAPDYELILEQGCDLAIENTMIYHSPEVREKLESFGIPVFVDRSSYETHPLGRTEWVKLYGALLNKEEEAEKAFNEQLELFRTMNSQKDWKERPRVAFFYISANGNVKVRKSGDYLPKMIELAGGEYIFKHLGEKEDNASSTVNMQMEEFYATAKDADYIIYNSTIEGELTSLQDLLEKNDLLSNMKAVKEDHVFCTFQNLYQSSMETGNIILDINKMLRGEDELEYLFSLR